MSQDTNQLTSMIKKAPGQVEGLLENVDALTEEISALTEQRNAIQNGVCGQTKSNAVDLLENTILDEKGGDYVLYGPTFGIISYGDAAADPDPIPPGNLTDWAIVKEILLIPTPIYVYTPGDYEDLDQWVSDYSFGNDYITRPLTEGASYGFNANISTLSTGKSILEANASKVNASMDVMSRYAT